MHTYLPLRLGSLDHHIGKSIHRRAEAVEHRQAGLDGIQRDDALAGRLLDQRRGRRWRSGHWRVATIDGTSRWRRREVEGTLPGRTALADGRRAALFREEAGHRSRGRQRERSDRGCPVRTGGHRQRRAEWELMLLLLLLLVLMLLLLMLLKQYSGLLKLSLLQDGSSRSRSCRIGRLLTLAAGVGCGRGSRSKLGMVGGHRAVVVPGFFGIVDKVAPGPVGTEPDAVERTAQLGLVLWMTL